MWCCKEGGGNIFEYFYMCLCLFFTSYNTNFKNKLKCNQIIDCTNFLDLQNRPNFHSEERLISLVRRGECVVGLSILLVYGLGAPRLPAVCGGRTPGQDQEAGQVQQVDVHPHRQEHNSNYFLRFTKQSWALASFYCVTCVRPKLYSMSAHCQEQ